MVMAPTLPSHVIQCVGVDVVRCRELRRNRTNSSFAGNYAASVYGPGVEKDVRPLTWVMRTVLKSTPGNASP